MTMIRLVWAVFVTGEVMVVPKSRQNPHAPLEGADA